MMLHELSVQAVSDAAVLAKVKRSNYLLGVRAKRCQDGLGPEPAWCRKLHWGNMTLIIRTVIPHSLAVQSRIKKCIYLYRLHKPYYIFYCLAYMTVLCLLHWNMQTIRLIWLCMCHNMQKGHSVTSEHKRTAEWLTSRCLISGQHGQLVCEDNSFEEPQQMTGLLPLLLQSVGMCGLRDSWVCVCVCVLAGVVSFTLIFTAFYSMSAKKPGRQIK